MMVASEATDQQDLVTIPRGEYNSLKEAKERMDRYDACRRNRQSKYKKKVRDGKEK